MEEEDAPPMFSLILVIKDNPHLTCLTLDSFKQQKEQNFETIVVHNKLVEREIKLFRSTYPSISHIQFSKAQTVASMLNEGVLFANGRYLVFFFSGDYFLSEYSLERIKKFIEEEQNPDLVCTSFLIRDGNRAPEVSKRIFCYDSLSRGKITSRLSGCVFDKKMFDEMQGFDSRYDNREGLDLLCRIYLARKYRNSFLPRVVTDYEYIKKSPHEVLYYGWETTLVLYRNFGLKKALGWIVFKDQMKIIRLWLKSIKFFFSKG